MNKFDLIVIGAGAGGMMAAITASKNGKKVLILEKLPQVGVKLKATGGGRCNLSNTLNNEEFMQSFGKNGTFMRDALSVFNHKNLIEFFNRLNVDVHAPDGFHIFPLTHNANTIVQALYKELLKNNIQIITKQHVKHILIQNHIIKGVQTTDQSYYSKSVIVATGGSGYSALGTTGDGYGMANELGHKIVDLYPAMIPLFTKERWVEKSRADTISGVEIKIDMKKAKKLKAKGDLIFTKLGIRGPVVLDFAREITPLLDKFKEVPILLNLTKGMNQDSINRHFKKYPNLNIIDIMTKLIPFSVANQLCILLNIDTNLKYSKLAGVDRDKLINILAWTPLSIVGHDGYDKAMVTRGGVSLKEIDPKTMQSKIITNLYFCGEVVDLDGPCGGYNLQWSFASGYLAGNSV